MYKVNSWLTYFGWKNKDLVAGMSGSSGGFHMTRRGLEVFSRGSGKRVGGL